MLWCRLYFWHISLDIQSPQFHTVYSYSMLHQLVNKTAEYIDKRYVICRDDTVSCTARMNIHRLCNTLIVSHPEKCISFERQSTVVPRLSCTFASSRLASSLRNRRYGRGSDGNHSRKLHRLSERRCAKTHSVRIAVPISCPFRKGH